MKIKKFNQFNTSEWIGPLEILDIKDNIVFTNFGNFSNKSGNKLTIGYSYILRVVGNEIIDTGMSCVDLVVLVKSTKGYKVLSIKRGRPPFVGMWANPGGNIDEGEKPLDAAVRELEEETGLVIPGKSFNYVGSFDKEFRDPRNKNCVSHAFSIVLDEQPSVKAGDDATECTWNDVDENGNVKVDMAFDHSEIIKKSVNMLNLKNIKEPFVIVLVGPPLSGKTTWIKNNYPTTEVISRDEIVMEVYGSKNYTEAFKNVDQKEVDKVLHERLVDANLKKKNVIIDMTHMASKRRKHNLNYFSDDYYKMAVIFPILSDDEYERRNKKRIEEENKDLPMNIVKSMISSYQPISPEEGFDKVISI